MSLSTQFTRHIGVNPGGLGVPQHQIFGEYHDSGGREILILMKLRSRISRFDMLWAQAHWVGSKPIRRVMQLKHHKPAMAIGYSLRMCARHVDSTNPGRSNLVFRSKPIPRSSGSGSGWINGNIGVND